MPVEFVGGGFDSFTAALDRYRHNLDDLTPVWESLGKTLEELHAEGFKAQRQAGTSNKWAALSPEYKAWKDSVRPGRKILEFDGDLKDSLTKPGRGIRVYEPGKMVFGSDIPYAKYHMRPYGNRPARKPLIDAKKSRAFKTAVTARIQSFIVKGTVS